MDSMLKRKWVVVCIAIFCSILWGSAFPVLKVSYEELQMAKDDTIAKIVFAGMRFLLAGLILLVGLIFSNPKKLFVTKRQILFLVIFGILQTSLQYFFFYNGLAEVSGMQGAILLSSGTFFTVVLAHFFYTNDRINWKKTVGLMAGFAGIIVANWGEELKLTFQVTGEGYMILAALTSAIGTIMAKELAIGIHPFALTGWQLTIGAGLMLVIGIPQLQENAITFTPLGWMLFIYSALLSAVAFGLWYSILKFNKAGEISMFKFITPVSGAILSAMFIPGESLNIFIMGALILVATGIIAVNYKGQKRKVVNVSKDS
ncbi:MAG: DMT family transporter [Bacillota bacterium]|uniref:DMT family transporter n=1 Tax=Virgibacillus salarius TaxID=447199 RepID=A0A941DRJ6_9BACI|nr:MULTISPECIES: DMT family transporter [Virgibacillus]NAZ08457.1 EamA family transporter [Agaribacter marinus]MBR7795744.1 DMT family transporter [Virgibacillus salarius]MCC2248630.1 DMT family transporter [Virgibacillus sp. AGTR]MDY7043166.1 DMT family transporter [Virgibacillus sp. M23]QRZ18385.1 DMT family transporter [Virgibacillus sp. AGTR]